MKRLIAIVACVIVAVLVVAAVAYAWTSDGPTAYSVRGTEVSQQSIDAELTALTENAALQKEFEKRTQQGQQVAPLSDVPGSVTADTSSGWVSLRIAQTAAAQAVEKQGLKITQADKSRGHDLAVNSVTGDAVFSTLPDWFQQDLNERWTNVAVLESAVLANPTTELQDALAKLCPSGRYVSHILVDTEQQAASIKQAIDRGGDFAEIAKSTSKDGSATSGGALGCLDGQTFVEPFATVAKTQPIGVVSDPVQTEFGWHLILVTDQAPASDVEQVALSAVLGRTKGEAAVTVDPRYGIWDRRNGQVVPPIAPGAQASTLPASAPGG